MPLDLNGFHFTPASGPQARHHSLAFRARWPWKGGDMQTLAGLFLSSPSAYTCHKNLKIPAGRGHLYADVCFAEGRAEDWAEGRAEDRVEDTGENRPLIVLIHGMGGSCESRYMIAAQRYFVDRGWHVCRMNLRGVKVEGQPAENNGPYHAGLTVDLEALISALCDLCSGPLFGMGFSLGGHLLLRYLSEAGNESRLSAGVSVSAPINLETCQTLLERRRNNLYNSYLTRSVAQQLAGCYPADILEKLRTVRDVDRQIVAPAFGYASEEAFYKDVSTYRLLGDIRKPVLALTSADDPLIAVQDYKEANWSETSLSVVANTGGHVGFHMAGSQTPAFLPVAFEFLNKQFKML